MSETRGITLSPSDVRHFTICPWIVYYRKVLNEFSNYTSPQMAVGSFEHEYRRRLNSQLLEDDSTTVRTNAIAAREAYEFSLLNYSQFPDSITKYYDMLRTEKRSNSDIGDYHSNPVTEIEKPLNSTFELEDCQFNLNGRLDAVVRDPNQYQIPLDYKTGSSIHAEADVNQVISYALLMQENGYGPVPSILIHYVTEERKVSVRVTEKRKDRVLKILRSIHNLIESGDEPDIRPLEIEYCNRCHYRPSCEAKVGEIEQNAAN